MHAAHLFEINKLDSGLGWIIDDLQSQLNQFKVILSLPKAS